MSKNRIEAFYRCSDCYRDDFAGLRTSPTKNDTFQAFLGIEHQFIIYLISFVMLAIYWNNHHHLFSSCRTY